MSIAIDMAWQAYEGTFDRRRAAHLFRRAGFSANSAHLESAVTRGLEATVKLLLKVDDPAHLQSAHEMQALAQTLLARNDVEALPGWWVYRMLHTSTPLLEKTTLFWHGHFATSAAKVMVPQLMYAQNELLRSHALGSFEAMVQDIARDPAMLLYLDSATNKKTHPNENFARELMELFCLGIGNYSEKDVQQLARCFTGCEVQRGAFQFNRYQHDHGPKSVLGERGNFNGEDAVRLILAQPAMPEFICRKLIRFFVTDDDVPSNVVAPLAAFFRENELRIEPVIHRILSSNYFFSERGLARKIRSPVELAIGLLRSLEASSGTRKLAGELGDLGQKLFFPPNVKGWDGGTAWINSSTLLGRTNLVKRLVEDPVTRFAGDRLDIYIDKLGWQTPEAIVEGLAELLIAVPLSAELQRHLVQGLDANKSRLRGLQQMLHTMGSLPEFQLN